MKLRQLFFLLVIAMSINGCISLDSEIEWISDDYQYITSFEDDEEMYSLYYKISGFQDKVTFVSLYNYSQEAKPEDIHLLENVYLTSREDEIDRDIEEILVDKENNIVSLLLNTDEVIYVHY